MPRLLRKTSYNNLWTLILLTMPIIIFPPFRRTHLKIYSHAHNVKQQSVNKNHIVLTISQITSQISSKNNIHNTQNNTTKNCNKQLNINKKKTLTKYTTGQKIDIRDINYIWRQARIVRIISRIGQSYKFIKIQYLDCVEKDQEQIKVNSDRIAQFGYYTSRHDIPKFKQIVKVKSGRSCSLGQYFMS